MKQNDILAGLAGLGAGTAVLAVCKLLVGMPLWGAAILALAVCGLVIMLMTPGSKLRPTKLSEAQARAIQQAEEQIRQLGAMAGSVPSQGAQRQIRAIQERAREIVQVIRDDSNKWEAAEPFFTGVLTPIHKWIERYSRLATRDVKSATTALAKAETETLPNIQAKLDEVFNQLHEADLAWLMTGNDALEFQIQPIDIKSED